MRGSEFDELGQCQFHMYTGEWILSCTKPTVKTNNTLFIFTINKCLLRYRQPDSVLTEYVLWTLLYSYGVQIFAERHKPRKKMCVIICTLFDYRAWLSLCDRGVKHVSFMARYNVLPDKWYFFTIRMTETWEIIPYALSCKPCKKLYYCDSQAVIVRCKLTSSGSIFGILRLSSSDIN